MNDFYKGVASYYSDLLVSEEFKKVERKYRIFKSKQKKANLRTALMFLISGISIFTISYHFFSSNTILISLGVVSFLFGTGYYMLTYLQNNIDTDLGSKISKHNNLQLQIELDEIRLELQSLKKKSGVSNDNTDITETINSIINNTFTEEFIQHKIEKSFGDNAIKHERFNNLFIEFERTSYRINEELERLRKSANINLVIGSLFTTVAILSLTYEVFFLKKSFTTTIDLLSHYIPRISLVIFVEVFAFFFLKLYKSNLNEIKYFNNEKTNIDFKLISLKTALFQENIELIKICLSELIRTERNFILKKDESTVELEKLRNDKDNNKLLTDFIGNVILKK